MRVFGGNWETVSGKSRGSWNLCSTAHATTRPPWLRGLRSSGPAPNVWLRWSGSSRPASGPGGSPCRSARSFRVSCTCTSTGSCDPGIARTSSSCTTSSRVSMSRAPPERSWPNVQDIDPRDPEAPATSLETRLSNVKRLPQIETAGFCPEGVSSRKPCRLNVEEEI